MATQLDIVTVRKALPIAARRGTARHGEGKMKCTVEFDVGNLPPVGVLLLPVVRIGQKWLLARGNDSVPDPKAADVVVNLGAIVPVDRRTCKVVVPWPGDTAQHALLLLLHTQNRGVGVETLGRKIFLHAELLASLLDSDAREREVHYRVSIQEVQDAVVECLRQANHGAIDLSVFEHPGARAAPDAPFADRTLDREVADDDVRALRTALSDLAFAAPREPAAAASDAAASFTFALSSCLYPAGMLDGTPRPDRVFAEADFGPAHHGMWRLAERLRNREPIRAVILAGDQVYVDATAGLFDPTVLADGLRIAYRRFIRNPAVNKMLDGVGNVVLLMDDHEFQDNWDGPGSSRDHLSDARNAYLAHQRDMWPWDPPGGTQLWEAHELAGFPFFFADTRTEREKRTSADWDAVPIFGEAQARALREWIGRHAAGGNDRQAFVVSPAILVPRPLRLREEPAMALHADAWCGFPRSFHALLACLCDNEAGNIVFLSGDEHVSCVATLTIEDVDGGKKARVHSVHSSAFYAPFVFANAQPQDFADPDDFTFELAGRTYRCHVEVKAWCPGDGFALVTAASNGAVHVQFDREAGGLDIDL